MLQHGDNATASCLGRAGTTALGAAAKYYCMPKERVLVTGATGFIGQHLVRRLVELGVEVHCLVRASTPSLDLPAEGSNICSCSTTVSAGPFAHY